MAKKVKVPEDMTQAELFGVDELDKVTKDAHGISRLPDPWPEDGFMVIENGKMRITFQEAFDRFCKKVNAKGTYGHPAVSPLPWHWDMTSAETPIVCDANNVEVVRFPLDNGDGVQDERDWLNAELIVACVNKFAASISDDELDRLRKLQVYGDENHEE